MPADQDNKDLSAPRRQIRSYVLRQGRLTNAQQNALDRHWKMHGIDFSDEPIIFKEVFQNTHDVVVEIGFGNGDSLLQQAIEQPQLNFIGIEVHAPGVGHLIHNAHRQNVKNLRVLRHDAVEVLQNQIADASIHKLQLFFPDPWHKKRHHKRRIMKPEFIELIHRKLKIGGRFHMATDWQPYAEVMLEQMSEAPGFINCSGEGNYSPDMSDRCETKFERRGRRLGHGVWDLIFSKIDSAE